MMACEFLFSVTKCLKKVTYRGQVYVFWLTVWGSVCHGKGVAEEWEAAGHVASSQEAERSRHQCSACFLPFQSGTTAHTPQGAAHIQGAVLLQLNLSGNILVGTSSSSHTDGKPSQVKHRSLPVCALHQRKLRLRRLTKAARTPGAEAHGYTDQWSSK